ncbi:MAG: hypothetical protein HY236_04810 [Acidobacteria bacterium]|nr:hypothetical protein [Acidobacteriota bacterium]
MILWQHHADDGKGPAVQPHRLPHDAGMRPALGAPFEQIGALDKPAGAVFVDHVARQVSLAFAVNGGPQAGASVLAVFAQGVKVGRFTGPYFPVASLRK